MAGLSTSLLHDQLVDPSAERRWSYRPWLLFAASLFIAFHGLTLLLHNLPAKGLSQRWRSALLEQSKGSRYFSATRNSQSWAMFAPDPNRSNSFYMVYVEDREGERWDFGQDIWGEDRSPYWFYDRRGKVNRNLNKEANQRIYGAWVCREWERTHGGERAKSVFFVKRWSPVPKPREVIRGGGWDRWARFQDKPLERVDCARAPGAQLPNEMRARFGLPIVDEQTIHRVEVRTWVDERERERKLSELHDPGDGDELDAF